MGTVGFTVVATGFGLAEGPTVGADGTLYAADTVRGGIRALDPDGRDERLLPERRGIGGLALHGGGGLLVGGRDIALLDPVDPDSPAVRPVLTDGTATGFNDLGVGPRGELLAGVLRYRPLRGEPPRPGEVRIIAPDGVSTTCAGEVIWPNGLAVSADGWLYAADFALGVVLRGKWTVDTAPRLEPWWTSPSGQADGLAVDQSGAVWVALGGGGGVARVLPDATVATVLHTGAAFASSVCFAGPDRRDLIVTTGSSDGVNPNGSVLRARADVPGLALPAVLVP